MRGAAAEAYPPSYGEGAGGGLKGGAPPAAARHRGKDQGVGRGHAVSNGRDYGGGGVGRRDRGGGGAGGGAAAGAATGTNGGSGGGGGGGGGGGAGTTGTADASAVAAEGPSHASLSVDFTPRGASQAFGSESPFASSVDNFANDSNYLDGATTFTKDSSYHGDGGGGGSGGIGGGGGGSGGGVADGNRTVEKVVIFDASKDGMAGEGEGEDDEEEEWIMSSEWAEHFRSSPSVQRYRESSLPSLPYTPFPQSPPPACLIFETRRAPSRHFKDARV